MTPQEFGDATGFNDQTIRRYIKEGKLRAYKIANNAIRIDPAEGVEDLKALAKGGEYETPETA